MAANTPGEPSEPITPALPEPANGETPPTAEFLADLNGRAPRPARPATRRTTPQIDFREVRQGTLPGNKYIRVLRAQDQVFKQVSPDYLVAGEQLSTPRGAFGRLRRALIGRPIATEHQAHERLTNVKALAIFS
ncbi:MAG TPA: hypothetical protein VIG44_03025, partial [Thermomicrobiales bacterium]